MTGRRDAAAIIYFLKGERKKLEGPTVKKTGAENLGGGDYCVP